MYSRLVLLAAMTCLFLGQPATLAQTNIPDTPAGKRLAELVEFVNGDADSEFLKNGFHDQSENAVANRKQQTDQVRTELGKFEIQKTKIEGDHDIAALVKTSKGPQVVLSLSVTEDEPHRIKRIELEVGGELAPREDEAQKPLTAKERSEVIERLVDELNSKYVFPEVAKKMSESLEKAFQNGEYSDIDDAEKFANQLTDQLREICKDKHLRIRPRSASRNQARRARREVSNHGFVKAEMLPGGIGYLKFNFFDGDPDAEKTAAAAMNFLASSKSIIFDLRENGGGSPDMIAFLSGYIFDESVHLNSFYNRPSDTTTESWSRDDVPGKRLGEDIPVYVLTSNYTFSGAEEFSYNLKHLKRGVIVGETTGGGAHPVRPVSLGPRFQASMPFARAINPITKTNWEGSGVKPHFEVASENALEKALELAEKSMEKTVAVNKSASSESTIDTQALNQEAQQLMGEQEFGKASMIWKQIVESDPGDEMAWFQLGYCLHISGQLDEAIDVHKKAMEFERVTVLATYNLACAFALQNKPDDAMKALELAITKGFDDVGQLRSDSDFDNLRKLEKFKQIVKKLSDQN